MRYLGRIPTMIYVCTWIHTLNNVKFLVISMYKEHGRPTTQINKYHPLGGNLLPRTYVCFTRAIFYSQAAGRTINSWQNIFIHLSWLRNVRATQKQRTDTYSGGSNMIHDGKIRRRKYIGVKRSGISVNRKTKYTKLDYKPWAPLKKESSCFKGWIIFLPPRKNLFFILRFYVFL